MKRTQHLARWDRRMFMDEMSYRHCRYVQLGKFKRKSRSPSSSVDSCPVFFPFHPTNNLLIKTRDFL